MTLRRFLCGNGPVDAPLCLDRRRIYILPSRAGLGFALLLLVMLIGAINYDNSLAYLLTFLLAGISVVTLLHTYRGLPGLCLRLGQPAAVFSGEPARVPLWVDNTASPTRCGLVCAPQEGALDCARWVARQRPDLAESVLAIAHLYNRLRYAPPTRTSMLGQLRRRVRRLRV